MAEYCGFLHNCFIKGRDDDEGPLFIQTADGLFCRLDGYAIIPREEYEALLQTKEKDGCLG